MFTRLQSRDRERDVISSRPRRDRDAEPSRPRRERPRHSIFPNSRDRDETETFNLQDRDETFQKNVSRPPRDRDVQDRDYIPARMNRLVGSNTLLEISCIRQLSRSLCECQGPPWTHYVQYHCCNLLIDQKHQRGRCHRLCELCFKSFVQTQPALRSAQVTNYSAVVGLLNYNPPATCSP